MADFSAIFFLKNTGILPLTPTGDSTGHSPHPVLIGGDIALGSADITIDCDEGADLMFCLYLFYVVI